MDAARPSSPRSDGSRRVPAGVVAGAVSGAGPALNTSRLRLASAAIAIIDDARGINAVATEVRGFLLEINSGLEVVPPLSKKQIGSLATKASLYSTIIEATGGQKGKKQPTNLAATDTTKPKS